MKNVWAILLIVIAALVLTAPVTAATTSLTITKLASDGTTVLDTRTVDYNWMMTNLPVLGDGTTHYYAQGPVMKDDPDPVIEELIRWNVTEDTNVLEKDMGAIRGTNVKDLCDLVGGMNAGETIQVKAPDGFNKYFAYKNVYEYSDREGPMAIAWEKNGLYPDTGYSDGMRLVWFADNSINPWGVHALGNWDWHEAADSAYWYYYVSGAESYPTTTGLSVQTVSEIIIFSDDPAPSMDVLFDGTVMLTPGETFDVVPYNNLTAIFTVSRTTPLGALDVAATTAGFTYDVTDKNYATSGALLLDNVGTYLRDKTNGIYWYAYVNDVYKDGYNNPAGGLNLIELNDGDKVEFYYAAGITDPADLATVKGAATAAVKTVASTGVIPTDWSIVLDGAKTEIVTKSYFESGLACAASGHQVFWTDGDGNVWGGVPLWVLAGMVDDDPDVGPLHFNFNDDLATQHYEVKVISSDGWSAVFDSADVAQSSDYLVANTMNGEPLIYGGEKPSWPLHLKGAAVLGGQQVGGIVRIELNNLPEPPAGWTLSMLGEVGDVITQEEFEEGLACPVAGHSIEWTDAEGNVWSGMPLWLVLGAVDDIELSNSYTFNDDVAAAGYTVKVTASDGFSKTFSSAAITRNNSYIVANKMNDLPLDASIFPLRLVGAGVTKSDGSLGGSAVGKIAQIEILELQTPPAEPGSYNLAVKGKITDVFSQIEIEDGLACPSSGHLVTWTQEIKDTSGTIIETHEWSGIPLWFLAGWVDDRVPHEFNAVQASAGYKITVRAADGYAKDFPSADVAWSDDYIVATMKDGAPLPTDKWPLQLVGDALANTDGTLGGMSVSKIAEIELTEFGVPTEIPKVHIVKYAADGMTVIDEVTVDYTQLQEQFTVVGDGETQYRYQGVTMDPEDIWGETDETKGGFKVSNAVKGTRVADLVSLVGGMGEGTDIVFVASDGFKTTLPYTCIYTTPEIQARQGDAILAWYADGNYVPGYADGMRLFFMPEDTIYGQWDMHETIPAGYWHYYYQAYMPPSPYAPGILYPSCAGLSAKYITEIKVYTTPESTWDLHLDGTRVGGIEHTIAKGYFEAALACQMGANHDASYTDASGNIWTGMPLWFLQGFVDDADQHSNNAYNEALALEGYDIIVMASDGYNKTFSSVDTVRSTGYILANTLNGYHIPEADASWPLRLLGDDVPKKDNVKKVSDIILNFKPNVSMAYPSQESLWPVNKDYVNVTIEGVTDPYDEVTISIISITSDEPTTAGGKNQAPDADPSCIGTDTARIRAERIGSGNGRVYEISFVATDSMGVSMEGTVNVFVPHDQGMVSECIDDGQMYDATAIN